MLRSLVGSEMCIRDSYDPVSHGALLPPMERDNRRQAELSRRPANPANTCLLYTSDAADDLLCVDLGGRRLIKKKK